MPSDRNSAQQFWMLTRMRMADLDDMMSGYNVSFNTFFNNSRAFLLGC